MSELRDMKCTACHHVMDGYTSKQPYEYMDLPCPVCGRKTVKVLEKRDVRKQAARKRGKHRKDIAIVAQS